MAATDAKPLPIKNQAYRYHFPMYKNDGTLFSAAWTGTAAQISKDGAAYANTSNSPVEVSSIIGRTGYIDLTASEMNADSVMLLVQITNTDATVHAVEINPAEVEDIPVDTQQIAGTAAQGALQTAAEEAITGIGYTGVRAGYLDNLLSHVAQTGDSFAIVNSGVTGNAQIIAALASISSVVTHVTYGNSAIQQHVDILDDATNGLAALRTVIDTINSIVGHVSSGNAATKVAVDAIKAVTDKADDTYEDNGGVYRFTAAALANVSFTGGTATLENQTDMLQDLADLQTAVDALGPAVAPDLRTEATITAVTSRANP